MPHMPLASNTLAGKARRSSEPEPGYLIRLYYHFTSSRKGMGYERKQIPARDERRD
jgi:hypothetical protein